MGWLDNIFGSSKTTNTNTSQSTNPWGPAIPGLQDIIARLTGQVGNAGPTDKQNTALGQLEGNATAGDPWTGNINDLTKQLFASKDYTPGVDSSLDTLKSQLTPYANGSKIDPMTDPTMRAMLDQVGNDTSSRINSQYAGAGRDMSGMNSKAIASGLASAELPIMSNYSLAEQQNQLGAAGALNSAGVNAATTKSGLDTSRAGLQSGGIATGMAGLDAENWGPNAMLNLEEQKKMLPTSDLTTMLQSLGGAASLGGTSTGTGTSTTQTNPSPFSDIGNVLLTGSKLGQILISDERAKEDAQEIGKMKDGTPIYRYRYKGDPAVRMGVMAQDVEKTNPGAVTDFGGLKAVDYDKATRRSAGARR